MTTPPPPTARAPTATIVTTAAVTLALGVTVAVFTGYLRPPAAADALPVEAPTPAPTAPAPAMPAAADPAAPAVILVPVTREPPMRTADPIGDLLLASYGAQGRASEAEDHAPDSAVRERRADLVLGDDEDGDEDSDEDSDHGDD